MNKTKLNKILGFTLVELLVVISIIGILAALTLVSFTGAQKQARDVQRASDLKQYQSMLESWANTHSGLYPYNTNISTEAATTLCSTYLGLTGCPEDPKDPTLKYYYSSGPTSTLPTCTAGVACATKYVLRATHESTANEYWVVCSNGKSGAIPTSGSPDFSAGNCPLP